MRPSARKWLGLVVIAALALIAASTVSAAATQPRIALVLGNSAYPSRPLATATSDAGLVAQALAQAGFDVTAAADLDAARTAATFRAFVEKARGAGPNALVVVYLAGLGVQLDGDNYLVPVDARIAHAADAAHEAADLADLERALEAVPAAARLLVYDLARDNTFAARDGMPLAPGLALAAPPAGTLVAFDAAPGATAPDDAPPYGAYARALSEMIATPDLPVGVLLARVRLRVGELTDGAVVPWNGGAISDGLALLPSAEGAPRAATGSTNSIADMPIAALTADVAYSAVIARDTFQGYTDFVRLFPNDPLAARVRAILAIRREALVWAAAVAADDPRAYWTYLRDYPRGPHLFDARRRLAKLGAALEPPPRFDIFPFPDLPPPSASERARLDAEPDTDPAPIPASPGAFLPAPVAAYYDDLPPAGPAPAGALPIAAPLPLVAEAEALAAEGRITQYDVPGHGPLTARTQFAPNGAAALTLAGAAGGIVARVTTRIGAGGARIILQTGPKDLVEARTTTVRDAGGLTTTQTGADGATILRIAVRGDRDGGRTTNVTDAHGALVAELRRDPAGIVVERRIAEAQTEMVPAPPALLMPPTPPPSAASPIAPAPPAALPKAVQKPVANKAPLTLPPAPQPPTPKPPPSAASVRPGPPPAESPTPPAARPPPPVPASSPDTPPAARPPVPAPPSVEPEPAFPQSPPLPPRRPSLPAASVKKPAVPAHSAVKVKGREPKRRAGSRRK